MLLSNSSSSSSPPSPHANAAAAAATTTLVLGGYLWWRQSQKRDTNDDDKKFPIQYKAPPTPLILKIIGKMPYWVRVRFGILVNAPREPLLDARAATSNPNAKVYTKEVVVPNKLWRVGYEYQSPVVTLFKEVFKQSYGDHEAKCVIANTPTGLRDMLAQDSKRYKEVFCMDCAQGKAGGYLKSGASDVCQMTIVRLEKSGGLLLYSPVRIHDDLKEWIDNLALEGGGFVEWIVIGSAGHTTNLRGVIEQYPNAKIVGPWIAQGKLQSAGLTKDFDYLTNSTDPSAPNSLHKAQELLLQEGIELIHIEGDKCCNAILLLTNEYLLECDVAYGHHSGERVCFVDEKHWKDPESWFLRHFYYDQVHGSHSPNGYLPDYRFQVMDWTDPMFKAMGMERKRQDCLTMFASLQNLVSKEFQHVIGVHMRQIMDGDDFRKSIDKAWSWLDLDHGRSILSSSTAAAVEAKPEPQQPQELK